MTPVTPEFGPASPAGPGRASFGFSDGPISGNRPLPGRGEGDGEIESEPDSGALPIVRKSPSGEVTPVSPAASSYQDYPDYQPAQVAPPAPPVQQPAPPHAWEEYLPPAAGGPREEPAVLSNGREPRMPRPDGGQSRLVTGGMVALGVVCVVILALTGVVFYSGPDSRINQMLQLGDGTDESTTRTVTAPLNDRSAATFELLAATDRVTLSVADLGEDLFRISTPDGSGLRPSPELTDDGVRLQITEDGEGTGDNEIQVVLSLDVRWKLRFSGYAAERVINLGDARVEGIEMVGGTRRAEIALSAATATVPVKILGGVEDLTLRAPEGNPIRVQLGGGATTVTAGTRTLRDVAPGSTLTPKDWDTGGRYDVTASTPITLLTVESS
ncbi:hypothetical protein [Actinoplanes sp. NPDC051851]|uniref:hypothetical protein n=1 Tax=Actinoplanes sp. NPDC051851 TaxID=3154753 RepID=UPI003443D0DD